MCGIAGIVDLDGHVPPDSWLIRRMTSSLRHRGPDEFGIYLDERIAMGHARLSIIDVATGQQPLTNEEGSIWIVYNGEVYNYIELRNELQALGHRFKTSSDTEVIVHAYEEWGGEMVGRFNGQFAIALWDSGRRRLFMARDRLGIRPLYYAIRADRLYFASEVKAIFTDPTFPREFDPRGIDQVFTFWTTVAPTTPFKGIRELPPGHALEVDASRPGQPDVSEKAYWRLQYPERGAHHSLSIERASEELLDRLYRATELRMLRADVPVGSYLSGGIDSSVIAALGRRSTKGMFRTYSVRFADEEFDETRYQRMMVEYLESDHADIMCEREGIAAIFPDVVYHTERPVLRTAPAPLYMLSGLVRDNGFKVVLTGEGSDEFLAGYDIFREAKIREFWSRQPQSTWRPLLLERLYPYLARSPLASRALARKFFGQGLDQAGQATFSHHPRWASTAALKRLFSPEILEAVAGVSAVAELVNGLPEEFGSWDLLSQSQYLEIRTLLSGYLLSSQGDRMLMAHSVEGRFPFLDHEVVEFCNSLPPSYKLRVLDEKHLLKQCSRGLVPDPILTRSKQPYRAPDAPSFVSAAARGLEYIRQALSPQTLREAGVFDADRIAKLMAKCESMADRGQFSNADNMAFIGALSTQLLWERLIKQGPQPAPLALDDVKTAIIARGGSGASESRSPAERP
jgi:asparagine synthase (glutamine-hydrolysing)